MQADKETMPKENKAESDPVKDTNGEKNGDSTEAAADAKEKLSLGEIAIIDGEIAKAKTEQLQVLHNVRFIAYAVSVSLSLLLFNFSCSTGKTEGELICEVFWSLVKVLNFHY